MALLLEEQPKNHQPTQKEMKTEQPTHETILTFGTSQELEVKLDDFDFDFDPDTKENIFSSLCFTSPSIVSENDEDNNKMFSYIESFSPEFISPTTNSESNNIFHFNDGLGLCVQTSDSDFSDNVSAPTSSVSNSSIEGLDFHSFDEKVDFDNFYSINS
ncbi:hypothetical protein HN51_020605 [Arachis hypogaea]|nr:uncharacterized protein LOC112708040 [Arachis hypogaea]